MPRRKSLSRGRLMGSDHARLSWCSSCPVKLILIITFNMISVMSTREPRKSLPDLRRCRRPAWNLRFQRPGFRRECLGGGFCRSSFGKICHYLPASRLLHQFLHVRVQMGHCLYHRSAFLVWQLYSRSQKVGTSLSSCP